MLRQWRQDPVLISALAIAALQLLVATAMVPLVLASADPGSLRHGILFGTHVAFFGGAGAYVLWTGWTDDRARSLGTLFLVIATSFASVLVDPARMESPLAGLVNAAYLIHVDAFTAYFFWRFASAFPRTPESTRELRWFKGTQAATLTLGAVFAAAGMLDPFKVLPAPLRLVASGADVALVFAIQGLLILIGLVVLAQRTRRAPADERRRAAVLLWGIAIGLAPMLLWQVFAPIFPSLAQSRTPGRVIYPAFLSMAVSVPYAVVGRQALDISIIVRRAVHYAISRFLAGAVLLVPPIALVVLILRHRHEPLAATLAGNGGFDLLVLLALSMLAYHHRSRVLHMVDRAFFRERYDAERIKADLEHVLVEATTPERLARSVNEAVSRALHPTHCELLLLEESHQQLVDPLGAAPALSDASRLVTVLSRTRNGLAAPLLERAAHPLRHEERAWLDAANANLLFPVVVSGVHVIGVFLLGEKQSGLAFTEGDRRFVREVLQLIPVATPEIRSTSRPTRELAYEAAAECTRCGAVAPRSERDGAVCERCGGDLSPALLPAVVAGKFHVDARIAAGGMGVVYRGRDVTLDRPVALKTLPHSSFDDVERLRREARAMAAVEHPHLASIYSLETWAGRPILVCEYLARGTLADRLESGPMPPAEAIALGRALAGALSCLHRSGILHRDIKPSNIGFAIGGEPKLLDFGLARILYADESLSSSSLGTVAGTLRYVSPDVLNGGLPTTDSDIWSLSVSLYESVAGVHPYEGRDILGTQTLARSGKIPDIREYRPETPPAVAEMFKRLLSPDPRERPATATAFMSMLATIEAAQAWAADLPRPVTAPRASTEHQHASQAPPPA